MILDFKLAITSNILTPFKMSANIANSCLYTSSRDGILIFLISNMTFLRALVWSPPTFLFLSYVHSVVANFVFLVFGADQAVYIICIPCCSYKECS